jgi:PAS domain S-box-containing protein
LERTTADDSRQPSDASFEAGPARVSDDEAAGRALAEFDRIIEQMGESRPLDGTETDGSTDHLTNLRGLLQAALAVNSSLRLDRVPQAIMRQAVNLMQAERGLVMLADDDGALEVHSSYNISDDRLNDDEYRISRSVTEEVARSGEPVYCSDAMSDERYAGRASVRELHLRSIICVPIRDRSRLIGVIYLDNSSDSRMFLRSDLYLLELFAMMVGTALRNARAFAQMRRLRSFSERIIEQLPIGALVVDEQARLVAVNRVALQILDWNREEIETADDATPGDSLIELLPPSERPRWRHMLTTSLTSRSEFADPRFYHNTGYLEKVLSLKMTPVEWLPTNGPGVIVSLEDITDKVLMEKYFIVSEKLAAKGEMAASIAHELNNNLAVVANNAELIGQNLDREEWDKVRYNARTIQGNIDKVKQFVHNLIDFSRPDPDFISYDIRHLIEDLLFSLRTQPRFQSIRFNLDYDPNLPNAEMDVAQIQQMVSHLLTNAAEAIRERAIVEQEMDREYNPEITIETTYDKSRERITLTISDNGIGIAPEIIDRIFNLHFTTKRGNHGTGLHSCQRTVKLHRGVIDVESSPGEGTSFVVSLPRLRPRQAQEKQ